MPGGVEAWGALTPRQKQEAARWHGILRSYLGTGRSARAIAREVGEKRATVARKLRAYREGLVDKRGEIVAPPASIAALAGLRKGPERGRPRPSVPAADVEEIKDRALLFARRTGRVDRLVGLVHGDFVHRERVLGTPSPSRWAVRTVIRAIPRALLIAAAAGEEGVLKRAAPLLVTGIPDRPLELVFEDQWTAHNMTRPPEDELHRLVHVHCMAVASGGLLLGVAIGPSLNGDLVAQAVIDMIRQKEGVDPSIRGRPEIFRCDLGWENKARHVLEGLKAIGCQVQFTTPRLPQAKGLVEVLHKILDERFSRRLPYYCPSDVRVKPLRDEAPLSDQDYIRRARAFLFGIYNRMPYVGRQARGSLSRLELWHELWSRTPSAAITYSDDELHLIFAQRTTVTVLREGIRTHSQLYRHDVLFGHIGEKMEVARDPRDLSRAFVFRGKKLLCVARDADAEAAGMTEDKRREFLRDRRTLAKSLKAQADERIRAARALPDWMAVEAERNAAKAETEGTPQRKIRGLAVVDREAVAALRGRAPAGPPVERWKSLRRFKRDG